MNDERIPWIQRLAYAFPALALAAFGIPVFVHLPKFYTDVVGIPVGFLGTLVLVGRLLDAVTDPVIGELSDRTRTRLGRRRPYLWVFPIPLALITVMLFAPPAWLDAVQAQWWFGVSFIGVFLVWTAVLVPYEALGAELSRDYDERTTVLGLRDAAMIAGVVVASAAPLLVREALGVEYGDPEGERATFRTVALIYAPWIVLGCWLCAGLLRERPTEAAETSWTDWAACLGNQPFRILLISYTVAGIGSSLPVTLIRFFVEDVLGSARVDVFLVIYLVIGIGCLPGWIWLTKRLEKRTTWLIATTFNAGAFSGVFFLGPGDEVLYGVLVGLSGIGFGATLAIPSSMQADVIDYGELLDGHRREGQYVGLWAVSRKLTAAFGSGVAFVILGWAGYQAHQPLGSGTVLALKILYVVVPVVCYTAGVLILYWYPITRDEHGKILAAIRARHDGQAVEDPLTGRTLPPLESTPCQP